MNYKIISKTLGKYLFFFSIIILIPLLVAIYYQFLAKTTHHPQNHSTLAFTQTLFLSLALSSILTLIGKNAKGTLMKKESILLVVLIWIFSAFISASPFYFSKTLENPIDAYFEAMSGLTTTGSSVMHPKAYTSKDQETKIKISDIHQPNKFYSFYGTIKPVTDPVTNKKYEGIEAVGKALLFWRSFLQWLGGMGIVVLFLAVLPTLTAGGRYLYQMEVPGLTKDALTPRIKETASILWKLYLAVTIIEISLLILTNKSMPLFDAICISFSTLSTGGFCIRNSSIGAYNNSYTEWVIIFFMIAGSLNFALFFNILKRKIYSLYQPDYLFFFLITFVGSLVVILSILGQKSFPLKGPEGIYIPSAAIREGAFQAVSAQTSTGFATTNYDLWPFAPQLVLFILMYVGGMSGSTAGGIKTSRIYILMKIIGYKIKSLFHPDSIKMMKIGKQEIDSKTTTTVLVFFALVALFCIGGTLLLTFDGVDPETSVSIVTCCLNNVGLAFRVAGPTESFAFLSNFNKLASCFLMLLGRLEYFTILLLFVPSFWKKS